MTQTDVREYAVQAASTDTFGRVLTSARNHHRGPCSWSRRVVRRSVPVSNTWPGNVFK